MKKIILLLIAVSFVLCQYNTDSILMTQIGALTLKHDQWTTSRRTSAVPQLKCIGGDAMYKRDLYPTVVQCQNRGTDDYGKVQWECKADLDERVQFGKLKVSCEGYSQSGDPYVLKGSCGLEYELLFTDKGKKAEQGTGRTKTGFRSSQNRHQQQQQQQREQRTYQQAGQGSTFSNFEDQGSFFGILVVIGIILALVICFTKSNRTGPTVIRSTPVNNPPPSMYPNPPYNPEYSSDYTNTDYTRSNTYTSSQPTWTTTATTTAAGFGAGYLLGRATAPQQPTVVHQYDTNSYPNTYPNSYPSNNTTYSNVYPDSPDEKEESYTTRQSTGFADSTTR